MYEAATTKDINHRMRSSPNLDHLSELEALKDFSNLLEKVGVDLTEHAGCVRQRGGRSLTSWGRGLVGRSEVVSDVIPAEELLMDEAVRRLRFSCGEAISSHPGLGAKVPTDVQHVAKNTGAM